MGFREKIKFMLKNQDFPYKLAKLKYQVHNAKKRNKQMWVFQCDYKGHFPYLKPYYKICKKQHDIELFFAIGYSRKYDNPKDFLISQGVSSDRILDPGDYLSFTSWDVYVSPTEWGNIFPKNDDALMVQIFHTLADKKIEYSKKLLNFNTIIANGPIHHNLLEKYIFGPYPESRERINVINTGFAKIDDLFNNTYNKEILKKNLNIDKSDKRPIALYAPNWEITSSLNKYGEEVFEILSKTDYLILIKLHYMSLISTGRNPLAGDTDWGTILNKYRTCENIRVIDETNINPYLFLADLMITDYGGVSLEFMGMDKPIIYLDCPEFFELRGNDILEKDALKTGSLINDLSLLQETIEDELKNDPHVKQRQQMIKRLLYNPGRAAKEGFSYLYSTVNNKLN